MSHAFHRRHVRRSFRLLAGFGMLVPCLVLGMRWAFGGLLAYEIVGLASMMALSLLGLMLVDRVGSAATWSALLLSAIAAVGFGIHAVAPGARFAPENLAVGVVLASLLLGPRGFLALGIGYVVIGGVARGTRIALGIGGDDALLGFVNLVGGYVAFVSALFLVDRQHRQVATRLEAEAQRASASRDAAWAAMEAKSRFLANMSHELRTPLNAILGYTELLEEEVGAASPDAPELLRRIHTTGSELLGHLDDVLEAARREARTDTDRPAGAGSAHARSIDPGRLAEVDPGLPAPRHVVFAGALGIGLTVANGGGHVVMGLSPPWTLLLVSVAIAGASILLALLRRPVGGILLLLLGGAAQIGLSLYLQPHLTDIAPYVVFLGALAALLVPPHHLARLLVVLLLPVMAGYAGRYAATGDLQASALPLLGAATAYVALVGIGRHRHALRTQLAIEAREAEDGMQVAQAAEASKTEFLARMGHDVRTPLTSIVGYGELLLEDLPVAFHDDLCRVCRAADHLAHIVDDLLDMATLTDGRLACEPEVCEVGRLCVDAVDLAGPHLVGSVVSLDLAEEGTLFAWADPTRVSQVLVNLLTNAGKYAGGGTITLRARPVGEAVCIEVVDGGKGIPAAALERLFEPFERLAAPSEAGGSGLGLAIARHLARAQGGDLTVESVVGSGSTFTLRLPRLPVETG